MKRNFSTRKITMASVLMASLTSGVALAADSEKSFSVRMNVDGKVTVPEWVTINYVYGGWSNVGSPHSCQSWVAPTDTVDWGESYQQSRLCKQTQNRTETPILFNPVLKITKEGAPTVGSRDVSTTEFRPAIGTRDYIDGERANAFGSWTRNSANYGCGAWSPKPDEINLFESFTQSRTCSKDEIRTRDVFHVWASGKETFKRTDTESRTVSEVEQQQSTGAKDYISGARVANWSSWTNDGAPYGCATWSPSPDTINLNKSFEQSRSCSQKQVSDRDIFDVWRSGKETLNRNEERSQVITVTQTQSNTGTKDFIKSTRNEPWSAWSNQNAPYGCNTWTPATDTVNLGDSYTQSRDCSQKQVRQRDVMNVWESGKDTLKQVDSDSQVITVTQEQSATGAKDYIVSQTSPSWPAWSNTGSPYGCSNWTPSPDTVNLNESFTQSRECSQDQTRSRTIQDVWKSGKKTFNRTETGEQTVTVGQTKTASGTKNYKTGAIAYGDWSSWANNGLAHSCSTPTPSVDTVNLGKSFTQERSCKQDQKRTRPTYDVWADGSQTAKGTDTGTRVIDVVQTNSATGTKDYITGTSTGTWGSWANSGSPTGCEAWSPAVSTVNLGESFTQTRTCDQAQTRSRTIYNVWKSGKTTTKSTETGTQTIDVSQSQSATGAKDYITTTRNGSWGTWSNSGSAKNCGGWTPSPSTVNLNQSFTQNRTCEQDQTRTRTVYNVWKSGKETVKSTESGSQTIDVTQSQSATGTKDYKTGSVSYGTWSGWSNTGSAYGCGSWSPAASTVNLGSSFTQSRTCEQDQTRTRQVYDVWASGATTAKSTQTGTQTVDVTQNQSATGTKDYITGTSVGSWGGWSNSGSPTGCSSWSPSTGTVNLGSSFTQSRTCDQAQTRTRTIYNVWKSGKTTAKSTETGTQTVDVTQSQSATGTKDYITGTSAGSWSGWSNSGSPTGCSSWSPSPSTVNLGASFTQSRTCDQAQTRTRTIYNVWKSGKTTAKSTESGSQTVDVTQTQSATGTKDYITGTSTGSWGSWSNTGGVYSCGSWSPATSTVDWGKSFTQSRTCKQNQIHYRTIYNVWKSGKTTTKTTESGTQAINVTQNQSATGTKNVVVSGESTAGAWSWTASASCGSYSPATSTVNHGASFTQSRSCSRPRERTVTQYNVWADGSKTVKSTSTETNTYTYSESRTATGTKDYVVSSAWDYAYSYSYGSWSCGSWSPATSTVGSGQAFTQTRSCSRTKTTNKRYYNNWKVAGKVYTGSVSSHSSTTESKTESQTAYGTKSLTWSALKVDLVGTHYSNAPGACFTDATSRGYVAGTEKTGACSTAGEVYKMFRLTGYTGNSCQITMYSQTCG
ncbi:MAG: hypothetical protein CL840_00050 [Crocinitomicaceae bacterium]|nr:hypothetical protein [Crocinitomicaceae bacterium]|tara:strand:- start:22907 stop:26959 length:4053 start_codon:yes stop_codon:yes gene_type:complete